MIVTLQQLLKTKFFYSKNPLFDNEARVFFMPTNPILIVYTLEHCPNCDVLKAYLKTSGNRFTERDLSTAESLTELRVNGIFVSEAPVLQKGDEFFTTSDLFDSGKVDAERITKFVSGA
jgi:glutaredoxin